MNDELVDVVFNPKDFDDVMVDLETMGKRAGCVILSIGAVAFSPEKGLDKGFYRVINIDDCLSRGMFIDQETQEWWDKQSPEAQKVLELAKNPETSITLEQALLDFNEYLKQFSKNVKVWGNGSVFDNAILIDSYSRTSVDRWWKYSNDRCYRTFRDITPWVEIKRQGTYHNAFDDAKTQAVHAIACIDDLRSLFAHKNSIEDLQQKLDTAIMLLNEAKDNIIWNTSNSGFMERLDKFIERG